MDLDSHCVNHAQNSNLKWLFSHSMPTEKGKLFHSFSCWCFLSIFFLIAHFSLDFPARKLCFSLLIHKMMQFTAAARATRWENFPQRRRGNSSFAFFNVKRKSEQSWGKIWRSQWQFNTTLSLFPMLKIRTFSRKRIRSNGESSQNVKLENLMIWKLNLSQKVVLKNLTSRAITVLKGQPRQVSLTVSWWGLFFECSGILGVRSSTQCQV